MAEAVARAIEDHTHLVVEAGTGVGKSFAYLVPAILAATDRKIKVVVSTHTIALQEQLLQKDIPFLQAVLPIEFTAVLVKGRVELHQPAPARRGRGPRGALHPDSRKSTSLATSGCGRARRPTAADRTWAFRPLPGVWDAVASETGNCLGRNCPRYNSCFDYQARRRIGSANLLIVNHALFLSDLALRAEALQPLAGLRPGDLRRGAHARSRRRPAPRVNITNGQIEYVLGRLANERGTKGLPSSTDSKRALRRGRSGPGGSGRSTPIQHWQATRVRRTAGSASR